jgi:uncharacterized protein YecE (DUF72 family)
MASRGHIHVGTSGWHYDHWKGSFYPQDMTAARMLSYYAERFRSVEINNTFYSLPAGKTLDNWSGTVPAGFLFAVKASRYITHMKKLKDPREAVQTFFDRVAALGRHLGPVLFQLPPRWRCNPSRLEEFLGALPSEYRYAFEFRDHSWFGREIYGLLREAGAAFCIYDLAGTLSPREVTADFVYIRLHGPGEAYQGSYDTRSLAGWAGALSTWSDQGRDIFCYFDNDQEGFAAHNALELQAMLDQDRTNHEP